MASIMCFATIVGSVDSPPRKPSGSCSYISFKSNLPFPNPISRGVNPSFQSLKAKATESDSNKATKLKSLICADCEGNGAKLCTQCKGTGVNSVDHFNGQFKAGALCWLCRGKKDILCGNCNGAGFIGGFMSTLDETCT
ncbi:bundle sheath defective protein 2 [Musa troglodytarum]|uniref:Bundle sheath defective protein 2 n=1 Tax=Musa troglodytarum TaxID=320322 RepID=A0A9E7ETF0_9LILI|nr:bundle sheath defective protein 2 [Musa troglodytarum]